MSIASADRRTAERLGYGTIGLVALLVYVIVAGGTDAGAVQPVLIALSSMAAGGLLLAFVLQARRGVDRVDIAMGLAVAVFSLAALFSDFPRQSLDAALAAFVYGAALCVARRALRRPIARRAFAWTAMAMSLVFTVGTAVVWGGLVAQWLNAVDWAVLPPLGFQLPGSPWSYRYDLALLLVLLYPAWWIGNPSPGRRIAAVAIGVLVAAVVILSGSRTLWLAMGITALAMAGPLAVRVLRRRRPVLIAAAVLGAAVLMAWVTGILDPLIQRVASLESLPYRLAMWGPSMELWLSDPVTGIGPGSFPWLLQLTPYFETNSYAPRHPDNAVVQLIAEAGVVGLIAAAIVVAVLLPRILRGRSTAARWATLIFLVACLGMNPTDYVFLVAAMIGWVAYAVPFAEDRGVPPFESARARRLLTGTAVAGLAVLALAQGAAVLGAFAHQDARRSAAVGDLAAATSSLERAVALDPGMALYRRELGVTRYLSGDSTGAVADLRAATALNRADDVAWRALAVIEDELVNPEEAEDAIDIALELRRADVTNLLVAATLHERHGDAYRAADLLVEVVRDTPAIVGAVGWNEVADGSTEDLMREALDRWETVSDNPRADADARFFLATVLGADSVDDPFAGDRLRAAAAAALRCESNAADLLEHVPVEEHRSLAYWEVRVRVASNQGSIDEAAMAAFQVLTGSPDEALSPDATANALGDGRWWGYRRLPTFWATGYEVPAPRSGAMRWLLRPDEARSEAELHRVLPNCP